MTKAYETKLVEIDKNISTLITTQAKSKGYDLVLAKSAVLMGGTDITDEIARQVKQSNYQNKKGRFFTFPFYLFIKIAF